MVASNPRRFCAFRTLARRRGTAFTFRAGPCSAAKPGIHRPEQRRDQIVQARFDAARDVEHLVGHVGLGGQDVRPRDVVDVHEVHGLRAVAEDERRLAGSDPLHPADKHLGVGAVDVHARPVDVEVAKRHVVQAVHLVEAAQEPFVECLRRAVDGAVVVRDGDSRRSGSSRPARSTEADDAATTFSRRP